MRATILLAIFLMNLASSVFSQSFICSATAAAQIAPQTNGSWKGMGSSTNGQTDTFILRPPTSEDLLLLKKNPIFKGRDYSYVIVVFDLPMILNACEYGFNASGYISCNTGLSDFTFNFPNKRFISHEGGYFLSGNNDYVERISLGTCIGN